MRKSSIAILVSALLGSFATTASAGVIYSNFGPGQTYSFNGLLEGGINNPISHNLQYTMFSFVATGSGIIDVVHAPVRQFSAAGANAITLYSDMLVAGLHQPNPHSNPLAPFVPATFAPLGISAPISAPMTVMGSGSIETFQFLSDVSLIAGNIYWMGMITDATSAGNWFYNNIGQTSTFCSSFGSVPVALTGFGCAGAGANTMPAFDIISRTAVPEPITLSLFGAGFAGMLTLRRRKQAPPSQD